MAYKRGRDDVRENETRRRKRIYLSAIKADSGCQHCGEKDPVVLDFHHLDESSKNDKLKNDKHGRSISALGWAALEKELPKCIVLCANCHRRLHHRLRGEVAD